MFLHIHDQMSIGELQERFHECFPQLQLAFYSVGHKRFASSDNSHLLPATERVGNVRKSHFNGALEIKSWHTVDRVEKALKDLYALNAQIFRRGDNGEPVQTTLSDTLTLKEQSDLSAFGNSGLNPAI